VREPLTVLLDQNVPQELALWLRKLRPSWNVYHASELNLAGKSDEDVFTVGQERHAVIVTFDEDFADRRSFPSQSHHGIVGFVFGLLRLKKLNRLCSVFWLKSQMRS